MKLSTVLNAIQLRCEKRGLRKPIHQVEKLEVAGRFMKPLANERKNSCFYGSDKMANVSAIYHPLIPTYKQMKVSVSEYFSKVFAKIVRRCTDYSSMLPMNMGLSTDKYQMFNDNKIRG